MARAVGGGVAQFACDGAKTGGRRRTANGFLDACARTGQETAKTGQIAYG